MLKGYCDTAIKKFEAYYNSHPSDREALIYLNNARAIQYGNYLKIGVSVPIGKDLDIAKEMLRGVAQAQNEINGKGGGINGKFLLLAIANDNNDGSKVDQTAHQFINIDYLTG